MVIDSSALLAVFFGEPEKNTFVAKMSADPLRVLSAGSLIEAGIVVLNRLGDEGLRELQSLIAVAQIEIDPVTLRQAEIAWVAYRRFGKGRHPAGLNFGDCFAYALAKATDQPLLFKGGDFAKTDIVPA
jgi:ribonuclease VapC